MPRLKKLRRYPVEYAKACLAAYKGSEVRIRCDSKQAARNLRAELYTFRRAVRLSPVTGPGTSRLLMLQRAVDGVSFHIDDSFLVVTRTTGSRTTLAVMKALEDVK